ncbi:carboxylase [Candidatus Mcinerneyibacteriota bacterium]|nr:carboxylase [Candidatus Mcinerneyibacteriota bacterium]
MRIRFNDVSLRDGHQSLLATRMTTEQILYVLEVLKKADLNSIEAWGGATLDATMRFLNEDPWERLDKIYSSLGPAVPIRALCRGQNLFGYNPYPDEIVDEFNRTAIRSGVGVMRIFDALNDPENLKVAVKAVKEENGIFDGAIAYTTGPVFDVDYFVDYALKLRDLGADIITIKDMAGLLSPEMTYQLITRLKEEVSLPLHLHTHTTPGYGHLNGVIAMALGIDAVDTAFMSMSGGSSLPSIEILSVFAREMGRSVGYDPKLFAEIDNRLREVRKELEPFDKLNTPMPFPVVLPRQIEEKIGRIINAVDKKDFSKALKEMHDLEKMFNFSPPDYLVLEAQIPGGMYTNLLSQLEAFNATDRIQEVMKEIVEVRRDAGYPPLVTPTSQIVGVQAVMNVIKGKYKMVTAPFKALVQGAYGKTPAEISPDFRKLITGRDEPSYYIKEEVSFDDPYCDEYGRPLCSTPKDRLLYLLFPQTAEGFLKSKRLKDYSDEREKEYEEIQEFSEQVAEGGWF